MVQQSPIRFLKEEKKILVNKKKGDIKPEVKQDIKYDLKKEIGQEIKIKNQKENSEKDSEKEREEKQRIEEAVENVKKQKTEEEKQSSLPKIVGRQQQSELEEQLLKERALPQQEQSNPQYAQNLAREPMAKIYHEMTSLYELAGEKGYLNPDEQRRVQYLASAVETKVQDAEEHRYTMTEEAAAVMGITRQMGSKLRDLYKGNSADYHPQYR